MSLKLLLVFAVTELVMSLTPGPAVLLVISQGMRAGFKPSLRGTLGIEVGNTIYFVLSALGLGALLVASANLFQVIRWLGVAYLILLGLKMLIFKRKVEDKIEPVVTTRESAKLFFQGLVTQLVNPRALVFFTALLPQFISPGSRVVQQFVVLGIVSIAVEVPVLATYGWLAARGGKLIPEKLSFLPDRIAGACLVGAGAGLASMRKL
jgi:homoserine/homoserine lactone efflux protein